MSLRERASRLGARLILAADESPSTADKRLTAVGATPNPETRLAWRQMLLGTEGLGEFVSGVILSDDIFSQALNPGVSNSASLAERGMCIAVKSDLGLRDHGSERIPVTAGHDSLNVRLPRYVEGGAVGTKFRSVFEIRKVPGRGREIDRFGIDANCVMQALQARAAQEAGLVPIVEPEVLMDGGHSADDCYREMLRVHAALFEQLVSAGVDLGAMVLKMNFCVPGAQSGERPFTTEVADKTISIIRAKVPEEVPVVAFLSGGLSAREATACLNQIARVNDRPWRLTCSYGRAFIGEATQVWAGRPANVAEAQRVLLRRAQLLFAALRGECKEE